VSVVCFVVFVPVRWPAGRRRPRHGPTFADRGL